MKKIFHYGCSFTENLKTFETRFHSIYHLLRDKYIYTNYGKASASNKYILNTFKETVEPNSITILQWSSLTRPFDENYKVLQTSDNPLHDYLEEWYLILEDAKRFAEENNIHLIQYIGWAQWKDEELNDYHRHKLKSFGIHWFESIKQWDIIKSNCFQLNPNEWSTKEKQILDDKYFLWSHIHWGGMSEWVRSNVDPLNRYRGWSDPTVDATDPHPSEYASIQFIKNFLLLELQKL